MKQLMVVLILAGLGCWRDNRECVAWHDHTYMTTVSCGNSCWMMVPVQERHCDVYVLKTPMRDWTAKGDDQ